MMPKYIPIIVVVLLLFVAAAGGYFFCWPKYQEFSLKKQELETKDESIRQREEYLANLENLSKKLLKHQEQISKIETALPDEVSVAAIFKFLQKTSSENGLLIEGTNIGELYNLKKTGAGVQQMPFNMSFVGSYKSFKNFLSSIYQNSRLIEVESISFSSPPKEEESNLFTFELTLQTYGY